MYAIGTTQNAMRERIRQPTAAQRISGMTSTNLPGQGISGFQNNPNPGANGALAQVPNYLRPSVSPMVRPATQPVAQPNNGNGLNQDENTYRDMLLGRAGTAGVPSYIKDAMMRGITSRLDEETRGQVAASDRDMIRRGFGINSGESLNQMNTINNNRTRAISDAADQVEQYADQTAWNRGSETLGQIGELGRYEHTNEQEALNREYNDWLRQRQDLSNIVNMMSGFAGLNGGLAGTGYQGWQQNMGNIADSYGQTSQWGMEQLLKYLNQ